MRVLTLIVLLVSACLAEDHRSSERAATTTVWSQNAFPSSTNPVHILRGFGTLHSYWGHDSISISTKHSTSRALRIYYAKGSHGHSRPHSGARFFSEVDSIPANANAMILKYDVFFENFGWGNTGKLPGIFGGVSSDEKYECTGSEDKNDEDKCFTLRLRWKSDGSGEIYAFIPSKQTTDFRNMSDVIVHDGNTHMRLGSDTFHFENNKWHSVYQEVHMNTVGHTDGWLRMCVEIDGQTPDCHQFVNLNLRNHDDFHPKGLLFHTQFGGDTHKFAAPNDCYTYFKNFEISIPPHTPFVVVG